MNVFFQNNSCRSATTILGHSSCATVLSFKEILGHPASCWQKPPYTSGSTEKRAVRFVYGYGGNLLRLKIYFLLLQESICLLWSQKLFSHLLNLISWTRKCSQIVDSRSCTSFVVQLCIPEVKLGEMQLKILELKIAYSNPITESWGTSTSNVIVNLEFQSDCKFQFVAQHTHTHTLSLSLSLFLSLWLPFLVASQMLETFVEIKCSKFQMSQNFENKRR
jgi:hypothetical protein